jgi:uncharacterized protein YndB with AHSA1/START domain
VPRTDRASLLIHADADAVYRALTDADARATWIPPTGMTGRIEDWDLREGGGYRMVLTYDDPSGAPGKAGDGHDVVAARFTELTPGTRVVEAVDFDSDDPAFGGTMTMTWSLTPVDDGTVVEVTAEGVPAGINREDHAAGMTSSLENLATYLG